MRIKHPRLCAAPLVAAWFVSLAAAQGPAPALQPLNDDILKRIPESYRALARQTITVTERERQSIANLTDEQVFSVIASRLMQRPEGIAFALNEVDKEPSAARRIVILRRLSSTSIKDYIASHPEVLDTLSRHASSDPDAGAALQALQSLRTINTNRLSELLDKRLESARSANDRAGLLLLSDEQSRHYKWFGEIAMPAFFRTPPELFTVVPEDRPMRAVAFGDFGTGSEGQIQTAAALRSYAKTKPLDFGITLGDNFYPTGLNDPADPRWQTEWEKLYGPLGIKFYPTLGNHDYGHSDSPLAELLFSKKSPTWNLAAPYYTFHAGSAQFFAIDTIDLTERQLQWLDKQLAQSKATWKVVYGHYQIYSATRGDNDEKQSNLVNTLLPILKKRKVDVYICGHDHNLQELKAEGGVHFFVAGAGGAGVYEFNQPNYQRSEFKHKGHGFAILEADGKSFNVRLIDADNKEIHLKKLVK